MTCGKGVGLDSIKTRWTDHISEVFGVRAIYWVARARVRTDVAMQDLTPFLRSWTPFLAVVLGVVGSLNLTGVLAT